MKDFRHLFFLPASLILIFISCTKNEANPTDQSGNWVARAQLTSFPRYGVASFVIVDSAYIVGGYDGTIRYNDVWSYNVNTNAWSQKASMPVPATAPGGSGRAKGIGFTVLGKGYVATGEELPTATNVFGRLKDTWEYTATTNTWLQKANFPEPNDPSSGNPNGRIDAMGFTIGNLGYLTCGFNGTTQNDMWQFDPNAGTAGTWTQITPAGPLKKRRGGAVFVYNNEAYIVTGENNAVAVYDFYKFTPATAAWTPLRSIYNISPDQYDDDYTDIGRSYGVGFVMNNGSTPKGYVTVGQINGANTMKTWEYDFATDLWTRKSPYESSRQSRTYATSFVVKGRAFVGLGTSINLPLDNLDEWMPNQPYNSND